MEPMSGVTNAGTVGTAVALGSGVVNGALMVKADPENTGFIYIGNDGNNDVDSTTGVKLDAGDMVVIEFVGDLGDLFIDNSVINEKVSWLKLSGRVM